MVRERNARAERPGGWQAGQTERKGPACGRARNTHTHVVWRFCCFLSFNQTVHEKQEKEEELSSTGVGWGAQCANLTMCVHTHIHTHSTRMLPRTGRQRRHAHTHWLSTPGHADTQAHGYTRRQMHMQVLWATVVHRLTHTHTQVSKSSDPQPASHPLLQAQPLSILGSPDQWCQQKHRLGLSRVSGARLSVEISNVSSARTFLGSL